MRTNNAWHWTICSLWGQVVKTVQSLTCPIFDKSVTHVCVCGPGKAALSVPVLFKAAEDTAQLVGRVQTAELKISAFYFILLIRCYLDQVCWVNESGWGGPVRGNTTSPTSTAITVNMLSLFSNLFCNNCWEAEQISLAIIFISIKVNYDCHGFPNFLLIYKGCLISC